MFFVVLDVVIHNFNGYLSALYFKAKTRQREPSGFQVAERTQDGRNLEINQLDSLALGVISPRLLASNSS